MIFCDNEVHRAIMTGDRAGWLAGTAAPKSGAREVRDGVEEAKCARCDMHLSRSVACLQCGAPTDGESVCSDACGEIVAEQDRALCVEALTAIERARVEERTTEQRHDGEWVASVSPLRGLVGTGDTREAALARLDVELGNVERVTRRALAGLDEVAS